MKRFFVIFLIGMMLFPPSARTQSPIGPDHFQRVFSRADQGKTAPQTFEGGQIRLISCRTGVKGLDGLMIGVDVDLKQGWQIRKPALTFSADSWQATPLPVFQTNRKQTEPWTDIYTGRIVFPIWLNGPVGQDADIHINYHLDLIPPADKAETDNISLTQSGDLFLPLPATESYPADTCALIHRSLKSAAIDLSGTDIVGQNSISSDNRVILRLIFPKKIEYAVIQPQNLSDSFVKESFLKGNIFQSVIQSKIPLKPGDKIPLNIQSTMGCYTWDMMIEDHPLPPYHNPLPLFGAIFSGFAFLVFSPLWCLLFCPKVRTQTEIKRQARFIQKITGISLVILLGLWIWNVFPFTGVWPLWWIILWLGIAIYGLWQPIMPRAIIIPMIILWPGPAYEWLAEISPSAKTGVVLWWGVCSYLAFNIWIIAPKWFLSLKKSTEVSYRVLVRIPYILLILWLGGSFIGFYLIERDPVLKQWPQGPAIVRITDPLCTACIKDRLTLFSKVNPDKIPLYRADDSSDLIIKKIKENQINKKNFSIFITTNGHEIILPPGIGYQRFYNLIKENF